MEMQAQNKTFSLVPTSFEGALQFAEMIAQSGLCPTNYKGKINDVFIAMQMGAEIGLQPMQAVQNIAVINGKPTVYGDALMAIVRSHPDCESVKEGYDAGKQCAWCTVKRAGQEEQTRYFSIQDAEQAGLLSRGPWKQYTRRMLQMRARSWALRDVFADALCGFSPREEVEDYEIKDVNPTPAAQVSTPQVEPQKNNVTDLNLILERA
ncbi:hypothetical protein PsalMR5_04926 (plasmid) [Piscirickettsia salmonis]|uniref:hypothetical protein n=1 Tax=Piscirickettsia salmonis TaxID=1238 RepID=UPI0012BAB0BA|nr:hypothetical protein [Piscirickettsia salmonis]QGP57406.1 hypothetical protein PsalSR1_04895 [Piscirickettsia salmonis]QGP67001.1 hypothetical protein PsalMR5_04926 [Piscirickettsia salmonis]